MSNNNLVDWSDLRLPTSRRIGIIVTSHAEDRLLESGNFLLHKTKQQIDEVITKAQLHQFLNGTFILKSSQLNIVGELIYTESKEQYFKIITMSDKSEFVSKNLNDQIIEIKD